MAMRIGVMMGDPAGIGAELTAQVLAGGTMSKGRALSLLVILCIWHEANWWLAPKLTSKSWKG